MRTFTNPRSLLLVMGLMTILACPPVRAGDCTTGTLKPPCGPVCGIQVTTSTQKTAEAYLGIRFAEPLTPDKRWTDPAPIKPWQETFAATELPSDCPQAGPEGSVHGEEDCLFINVWRPARRGGDLLPVMLFIYGGSFTSGGSNNPLYDGAYIAANYDVVVVTFNYRVGALGFLAYDEGGDSLNGNYGFLDQQAAMRWVQANIAGFDGDPKNVTLFGESAGAMSVGLHLGSAPESKNLFRTAIMESNPYALPYKNIEEAVTIGEFFADYLNCNSVNCMRGKSLEEIVAAQGLASALLPLYFLKLEDMLVWTPVIDGKILSGQPVNAEIDAPSIIGANHSEGQMFTFWIQPEKEVSVYYMGLVIALFDEENASKILNQDRYKVHWLDPAKTIDSLNNVISDYLFGCGSRHVVENAGKQCYAYEYTHLWSKDVGIPGLEDLCEVDATHACELPFVWHFAPKGFSEDEKSLSDGVATYWTNLGRNSQPNGGSAPQWPPFWSGKEYQILDTPIHTKTDPLGDICAFWDEIGYDLSAHAWFNMTHEMKKNYARSLKMKK